MKKRLTVFCAALALLLGLCACGGTAEQPTWQEQYDLGIRYLSEGKYQEAILAFEAAIEIDPKQPAAYAELANVYLALSDAAQAAAVLARGVSATGDADLQARLDSLESSDGFGSGGDTSSEPGAPAEAAGTLSLSDISYVFEPSDESSGWLGNEDAIGGVYINGTVNGPTNTRDVLVATFSQEPFSQTLIEESIIPDMTAIWKGEISTSQDTLPFPLASGFPVWAQDKGTTMYVVLIGLDENIDATGYAVVTVQIPE